MLTRPSLKNDYGIIKPFNAKKDYEFEFIAIGGDQVTKNRLMVTDNSTNTTVYDKTITTFESKHTMAANSLVNGKEYKVKLMTFNIKNESSLWSDEIVFKCLSDASLTISNIENGRVGNQTYLFLAGYTQAENSQLESYKVFLYDERKNILSQSGEIFDKKLEYEFAGLENEKYYFIEFKGISVDKLESSSGLIPFQAFYIQPRIQNVLRLENIYNEGKIEVTAKITRVLGHIGKEPISYENHDWINCKNGMIYFDKENGFSIEKDFTLQIWGKDFNENQVLIRNYSKLGLIDLFKRENHIYLVKRNFNGQILYQIRSQELIDLNPDDEIYIWVQQKGALFNLRANIIKKS